MTAVNPLAKAFALQAPELVSIVGGGGKTSLLFALADALPGRTVLTTTTRIFAAQMKLADAVVYASDLSPLAQLLKVHGRVLIVGDVQGEKAFGVPPELPAQLLTRADVEVVLVEADGSRMRPIKAPAAHEPVIPLQTTLVIPVVGIDALSGPIAAVAHRPELVASLLHRQVSVSSEQLTVRDVAALLTADQGGLKNVPAGARVIPFINKVERDEQMDAARQIARLILQKPTTQAKIQQVVIGALKSSQAVRETHSPVTAVILAAGQSKRMGQTKQLLPWGETTVLGQTIHNAKASLATDVWVVSGHDAEQIEAITAAEKVATIYNRQYAAGEMLSSLQTAVRRLPQRVTAVLVMLADQPMVPPAVFDQLLIAYWQGTGGLIAPVYEGQRGNPVLIDRRYFAELLALPPGSAPRELLRRHPESLHLVPVASDSIVQDLDEMAAYERLRPS